MSERKNNRKIITKWYIELLYRKPDKTGLEHYLHLMDNGHLDEEDLVQDIKNSDEYKNIPKFITHIKELGNDAKSSPAT